MIDSGRIQLDGDVIRYRSATYGEWDLPLADVRVIGESTDEGGPLNDDYWLCFATGPGVWREASFYAEGRDPFLRALGARLGCELDTGLQGSTTFDSRVPWPPALAGQPMFQYADIPPKTWLGKLLGPMRNRQTYAEPVAAVLAAVDPGVP